MNAQDDTPYFIGTAKVGERGQVVIPKHARKQFSIEAGDTLMVIGNPRKGITFIKADKLDELTEYLDNLKKDSSL